MVTASKIFNLESQGQGGTKVKIQRVEYQSSILRSGIGAAGNIARQSNINPAKYMFIEPP